MTYFKRGLKYNIRKKLINYGKKLNSFHISIQVIMKLDKNFII